MQPRALLLTASLLAASAVWPALMRAESAAAGGAVKDESGEARPATGTPRPTPTPSPPAK